MPTFIKNLTWNQFMQLAGVGAVATLMGAGTISHTEGLPFLTGLVGLSINTKDTPPTS